ncbi:MAG: hypothetical protein IMF12_05395 [Proteobacteria bacterium]|nr:hypothetical protein [Pseudomonadota bacterium]
MKFAIVSEGKTDQAVIKNILYGFFANEDLSGEIHNALPFDDTEGGFRWIFKYLKMTRFHKDVLNHEYIIIQIDTDTSKDYDIKHIDENNKLLSINDLVNNVIDRLITEIEQGKSGFYQQYKAKIIFCICVHSIECWLLVHHCEQIEITNCFNKLNKCVKQVGKKRRIYNKLSQPFLEKHKLLATAENDKSLNIFLDFIAKKTFII